MKKLTCFLISLLLSFTVHGTEIDKTNVTQMIDQMVAQGIIPASEAARAKSKLEKISDDEWQGITKQAVAMAQKYEGQNKQVSNSPGAAAENIDFDGDMFKDIQGKIKSQMSGTVEQIE